MSVSKSDSNEVWYLSSIDFTAPTLDAIIRICIEKMWMKYDEDNSGHLDKEEARRFVVESIQGEDNEAERKGKCSD